MIEQKIEKRARPLSPHLTIYKPQITSVLSIFHRFTGAYLFFSMIFLMWLLVVILLQNLGLAFIEYNLLIITESIFLKMLLLATIFSLYYHLANGIRHLFWDIGKGYEISSAYLSGYLVIIFSILMTGVTVYLGFFFV